MLNKRMVAVKVGRHCFTALPEMVGLSAYEESTVTTELKCSTGFYPCRDALVKTPPGKVWCSRWPQLGLLPMSTCLVSQMVFPNGSLTPPW